MTNLRLPLRKLRRRPRQARGGFDDYRVPWPGAAELSPTARRTACAGQRRRGGAAILLHGVMPRSGTVYVGELLRLHPDLIAYPNELWEAPFLELSARIGELQSAFVRGYPHNGSRIGAADFLPVFGSAFLDYVHAFEDARGRRLLLKEAGVRQLGAFPLLFPFEHLLLLMRDGRDLVHSTLRTWPNRDFAATCREWAAAARAVRSYHELHHARRPACLLVKYEEVQADPEAFVRQACERFDLDPSRYPFERIPAVRLIGSSTQAGPGSVDWSRHEVPPAAFRPVGHWQEWPERRRRTFKKLAGAELIAAGYAADDGW